MVKMVFNVDERCNLADEVIAAIAEEGTIQKFVLYSNFEDKAEEMDMPSGIFKRNLEGLMKWLATDLKLILYAGNDNGLVTLSNEGEFLYNSNLTVKEYIGRKDKLRADQEATIEQNLKNAQLNGIYTIVKVIGAIISSILIPLIGFFAGDFVRTITIAIGSLIFGILWSSEIGRFIQSIIGHFVKD